MTTEALREAMRAAAGEGVDLAEVQWFDISDIENGTETSADVLMECRPPFHKCAVVYSGVTKSGRRMFMLLFVAGDDLDEGIVVAGFRSVNGGASESMEAMVYLKDGDMLRYGPAEEGSELNEEEAKLRLALLSCWYRAMLASKSPAHTPYIKPTFTNKRKIAAGKTPTYEWKTVLIDPDRVRYVAPAQSGTGTHASPRQHDRRGHLRRLRSGKNVWVRAHKVGSPELGAVFHDYEVRA